MCGVLFTSDPLVSETAFRNGLELLHHRGPDATGYARLGAVQFGHKRLKILDLDNRSNQPFYSHDGRYLLIFNGEIYNYRELAREYCIEQRTTGDTEVIVELFAKCGPSFLPSLNGMFAFVIFDTRTRELFVARDRLGVKPLYMRRAGDVLTLASE
jgi:asparagine synthase (glutamine-hydrolysing)